MIVRLADSLGWDVPTWERLQARAPAMLEGGYRMQAGGGRCRTAANRRRALTRGHISGNFPSSRGAPPRNGSHPRVKLSPVRRNQVKKVFRRSTVLLMAVVVGIAALVVAGATASLSKKAAGGDICVLMPDTATSIRWVHYDAPALKAEFKKAGV